MIIENMIKDNIKNMPPSGIRKYFDMVNEMENVISLGVGEPDFLTPWNVTEAGIYSLEQGHTHYSSNAGFVELRNEIAKYLYRRFNLSYNPLDEILVTVGGSEGIDWILCGNVHVVIQHEHLCFKWWVVGEYTKRMIMNM